MDVSCICDWDVIEMTQDHKKVKAHYCDYVRKGVLRAKINMNRDL